jgi:Uma2 family endonuclease
MPLYWTRNQPIEQIITHPPVAVFEILSPEDSMTRILRKLRDYADMGIPAIWVIDGNKKLLSVPNGQLTPASVFGISGEPMHFEMSEIEKLLD